jgi:hypothetical protein
MGSHALSPPFTLHAPTRVGIWIVVAAVALVLLGTAGLLLAWTLPAGQPTAPAHFQGASSAL